MTVDMDEARFRAFQASLDLRAEQLRERGGAVSARSLGAVRLGEMRAGVALAGVVVSDAEVRAVVERRLMLGARPLREALVLVGYAAATRWVTAASPRELSALRAPAILAGMRRLHALAVGPETALEGIGGAPAGVPGGWRPGPAGAYADGTIPLPPWSIPAAMESLATRIAGGVPDGVPSCLWVARAHGALLRIRPFASGNGRVARLLANWLLRRLDLPPWTIEHRRVEHYLAALRRADAGEPWPLAYEIATGVGANIDRLLASSHEADPLEPLTALVAPVELARLRKAVQRGRLRHLRRGGTILTTRGWLGEYDAQRAAQGRRPDEALRGERTRTRA